MRHADIAMTYKGVNITKSIAGDLLSFEYDENSDGDADSLSISLQNKGLKWMNNWFPESGDIVKGQLTTRDWNYPGEKLALNCGDMFIDDPEFSGPPNQITLKALSTPANQGWNDTEYTHTWKQISMRQLGKYFADKYGLAFSYDVPAEFVLKSLKQDNATDAEFLSSTAEKYNICMKVYSRRLILFTKAVYEARKPIVTLTRGKSNIISYSLSAPTVDANYSAAVESYTLKGKNHTYTFKISSGGKVLHLNESVDDAAQAEMVCKSKLREKNEKNQSGSLTLSLNLHIVAACTVQIKGFGKFDGRYFVDTCNHSCGGSAGQTQIDIHKCLTGGY